MNTLISYPLPLWISVVFLLAIPLPFVLITILIYQVAQKLNYSSIALKTGIFFLMYLVYVFIASQLSWFITVSFPPRVLLFTTFPFGILLFIILPKIPQITKIINEVSIHELVQLHAFRVIGVFFVILALHDALPKTFAFIAGFGDMITAISSFYVANAIKNKKSFANKLTYMWNIFGTIDILFTAIAANAITKLSIETGIMGVDTLAFFPYCIIPAFAPPTILFIHWLIFKKLKEKKE